MAFVDLNDAVISQVRSAADIVDVISQSTPLKQAGKTYKGLCPFHREKTPSFTVDRDKGFFYCFGCGTGGDVFKFVMLTERFNFPEAVEYVASRVGIQLPRRKESARSPDRENLLEAIEEAAEAFHQALQWTPNAGEKYLRERGIEPEMWKKYGFGYAPDSWDYILKRLGRKWSPKQLESAGLVLPRKTGDGHYDRFRNRLIVPIHSETGSVIGFGGRSLDGSDPKYLNSPETEIFNKSRLLYNLHRARDAMRRQDRTVLVEGYFDCLTLDDAGVDGVVASMGTSLTMGQAALIRRFSRRVIVCYDGDEAGRNATLRAAPVLLSSGLSVEVVDVGPGEDPDSFLKEKGLDAFVELLSSAVDVFDFAIQRLAPNPSAMRGAEKSEAVEALVPLIAAVSDPVLKNDAAQRVADRLSLEFSSVWSRVRGGGGATGGTGGKERQFYAPVSSGEKQVLRALFQAEDPAAVEGRLREEYFEDPDCRAIFKAVAGRIREGQPLDFSKIATDLRGESELTRLSELAMAPDERDADISTVLDETVRLMERRYLDHRLKQIQTEIQEAEREGDAERIEALWIEKRDSSRRLHALK
ncbi:MAG TPA: DNA primase [Thermoanaerobaculia bacterium]|nr:DNA primase [Thermoanaerobaculia bacterium]